MMYQCGLISASTNTPPLARALETSVTEMERCGAGSDAFVVHDLAFHKTLAQACGNPLFMVLNEALHGVFEASIRRRRHDADPYHFGALVEAHRKVASAVQDQDGSRAMAAMRDHFAQAELVATLLELDGAQDHGAAASSS